MNLGLKKTHSREGIKKQGEIFALDIGDSGVRLAQVSNKAKNREIVLTYLTFKDFSLQQDSPDRSSLINAIRELIQDSQIQSNRVVANLYGTEPILKFLTFPFMSDEELKKSVKWEASKFIVYDLDKMVIDYAVLNETEEAGKKKLSIVVVASTKESILHEINLLNEAGLEPISINVDILAQASLTQTNDIFKRNENVVFIEIAAKKTDINIIDAGIPSFRRECLSIGAMDIDKALKEELGIDSSEASRIRQEFSLDVTAPGDIKGKTVYNSINKVLNHAVVEIRRFLDYYMDNFPQKTLSRVVLTGGGACLKNIDSFLSHGLGLPVEIINPFQNIKLSDNIKAPDILQNNSARFTTVVGLALDAVS
jgi:type IV pilus assembly protein PilM